MLLLLVPYATGLAGATLPSAARAAAPNAGGAAGAGAGPVREVPASVRAQARAWLCRAAEMAGMQGLVLRCRMALLLDALQEAEAAWQQHEQQHKQQQQRQHSAKQRPGTQGPAHRVRTSGPDRDSDSAAAHHLLLGPREAVGAFTLAAQAAVQAPDFHVRPPGEGLGFGRAAAGNLDSGVDHKQQQLQQQASLVLLRGVQHALVSHWRRCCSAELASSSTSGPGAATTGGSRAAQAGSGRGAADKAKGTGAAAATSAAAAGGQAALELAAAIMAAHRLDPEVRLVCAHTFHAAHPALHGSTAMLVHQIDRWSSCFACSTVEYS